MKEKKKYVLIVVLALLLVAAIYANYKLNSADDDSDMQALAGEAQTTPSMVAGYGTAGGNYFDSFREERDVIRKMEIEYLDEIVATSSSDAETLAEAQQQKMTLVSNMEKEFIIESMLKAKGFADAAVTFQRGSVNVVVDCETLDDDQVAQILDIVKRETGETAEEIKIVPNQQ
ncbi:MAG: SpoIIIAH-like family protein [Clostridia bacterium]